MNTATMTQWQQIIGRLIQDHTESDHSPALEVIGLRREKPRAAARRLSKNNTLRYIQSHPWRAESILSITRVSAQSIEVSWSDPALGHYSDQPWCLYTSRRSGICALSGERIHRGEEVFRPRAKVKSSYPLNARAEILKCKIDEWIADAHFMKLAEDEGEILLPVAALRKLHRNRIQPIQSIPFLQPGWDEAHIEESIKKVEARRHAKQNAPRQPATPW